MEKRQYLDRPHVRAFCNYLARWFDSGQVHLRLKATRFVPGGIDTECCGIAEILENYRWASSWTDSNGVEVASSCWKSTEKSLFGLRRQLSAAIKERKDTPVLEACRRVCEWGGDRSFLKGAMAFLSNLQGQGAVSNYLERCKNELALSSADLGKLQRAPSIKMNSMLSKIHALLADDGLPIYDSRVAGAIGGLVELYLRAEKVGRRPHELDFPAIQVHRSAASLIPGVVPKWVSYSDSRSWVDAKVRLGWILRAVVEPSEGEVQERAERRMHAMEAALFMVGYDVRSLLPSVPI
jgi:hypothetical protein